MCRAHHKLKASFDWKLVVSHSCLCGCVCVFTYVLSFFLATSVLCTTVSPLSQCHHGKCLGQRCVTNSSRAIGELGRLSLNHVEWQFT